MAVSPGAGAHEVHWHPADTGVSGGYVVSNIATPWQVTGNRALDIDTWRVDAATTDISSWLLLVRSVCPTASS